MYMYMYMYMYMHVDVHVSIGVCSDPISRIISPSSFCPHSAPTGLSVRLNPDWLVPRPLPADCAGHPSRRGVSQPYLQHPGHAVRR